jgi:hypothetical protein
MINDKIRDLARSNHWQNIYRAMKRGATVRIFKNEYNFSAPQSSMMYWLEVYYMLYEELMDSKWTNLTEAVIANDYRCDAFLYWRRRYFEVERAKAKEDERKSKYNRKGKGNYTQISSS